MQYNNPNEHGYVSGNSLLLHNQVVYQSADWLKYLKDTHQYLPPQDEHKTFIYSCASTNRITEIFNIKSKLNLISFYSISGRYTVDMTQCLTELVEILSKMFVSLIPNQKILNLVGYKLLVYIPETCRPPFGFIRDDMYTGDVMGGVFPTGNLRLYVRPFQYNEKMELHALPCSSLEYSVMSVFYKGDSVSHSAHSAQTSISGAAPTTYSSGSFGTFTKNPFT